MSAPEKVEPGQVWVDNDWRSVGAGEFTVQSVVSGSGSASRRVNREYAIVKRHATDRVTWIRTDRLLKGGKRGYTYIGRQR